PFLFWHVSKQSPPHTETVQSKRVDTHDAASLDGLVDGIRQRLPGL
ncbi:hypothetical protein ACSER3_24550, partial [Pseudomonas aeruginosa]